MLTREIVSMVLQAVMPVIGAALALLMAQLTKAAIQYFNSKTAAVLLETLAVHVDAATSDVEATLVRDLKDPNKPGTWNEVSQATVKAAVVKLVHESAPELVRGVSAAMLGQMIEKSVARLPSAKPAVAAAVVVESATERVTAMVGESVVAAPSVSEPSVAPSVVAPSVSEPSVAEPGASTP